MRLAAHLFRFFLGALVLVSGTVLAGPLLHERFSADPAEDLRFGATTASGTMPLALETKSGLIEAPDETRASVSEQSEAYGGARTPDSADSNYYIDRLTTRPDSVRYDEPFRPSILPFKRLYAFDAVRPDLSFGVHSRALSPVVVGGLANATEDAFFADFPVDLVKGVPVRIPSVGPGARVRALHTDPPVALEILEDSAENWFVRGPQTGRVRMILQLSIERQTFGSQFRPVSFEQLAPYVTSVPDSARRTALEIAAHIGVNRGQAPARVLMTLVDYFRRFHESAELPVSVDALELYRELSFHQKGVCRHRSYAFAITALALGLPTRLVYNEAHAWVEVFDTELWHRVDLGGAATNINETRQDPFTPTHRPPPDPHTWPRDSQPTLAQFTPQGGSLGSPGLASPSAPSLGGSVEPTISSDPGELGSAPVDPGDPNYPQNSPQGAADGPGKEPEGKPHVELHLRAQQLLRGQPLGVSGTVTRAGRPCPLSRVDIYISQGDTWKSIGSVATDRSGEFAGQVTLPQSTPVGALEVSARVAGGCP